MYNNHGFQYVMVYGVDLDKWCIKYGLEPWKGQCYECYKHLDVNIPFASKCGKRGITALMCECGNDDVGFSYDVTAEFYS